MVREQPTKVVFEREATLITGVRRKRVETPFRESGKTDAEIDTEIAKDASAWATDLIVQEEPSGIAGVIYNLPAGEFRPVAGKRYRLQIIEIV